MMALMSTFGLATELSSIFPRPTCKMDADRTKEEKKDMPKQWVGGVEEEGDSLGESRYPIHGLEGKKFHNQWCAWWRR